MFIIWKLAYFLYVYTVNIYNHLQICLICGNYLLKKNKLLRCKCIFKAHQLMGFLFERRNINCIIL